MNAVDNVIDLMTRDHRYVEELLRRWERLARRSSEQRGRLLGQIVRAVVAHASVEERVLYPAVLDLPGGPALSDRAAREHAQAEGALARIERLPPDAPLVDQEVQVVIRRLREHLRREERQVLPLLPRHMTEERLRQLGRELRRARRSAPTRPHPFVPRSPAVKRVSDPLASVVDRARDAFREAGRGRPEGRHRLTGP